MKPFLFVLAILFLAILPCQGQSRQNQYSCDCIEIGIDSAWADSTKVACYKIPVLQNYDHPDKDKIVLAVAVAPATGKEPADPLLYLHGGPGISTLVNMKRYVNGSSFTLLREKHDLVFFDYRGTGYSEPDLCSGLMDSLKNFVQTNPSFESYQEKELEIFRDCRTLLANKGIDITSFSSRQIAADAESIRKALQIDRWNLYGVSYGTFIALKYMHHFPAQLKNIVLDSPFPPNTPWLDFVRPMDTALAQLQKTILYDNTTAKLFPDIRKELGIAVRRLNDQPVLIQGLNFRGDDFAWSVYMAMLKPALVPVIPLVIKEVAAGNDSLLQQWTRKVGNIESFGKHSAVQEKAILCYETRPKLADDRAEALAKKYPDLTSFNLGMNERLCDVFRPEQPGPDFFKPVVSNLPVLVLAGEFDPATPPYFGALTAGSLPNSRLMVVPGASHAVLNYNDCTKQTVSNFLINPALKQNISCGNGNKILFATANIENALDQLK